MRGLENKVAIVTGAATLLGREVAAGLIERGVCVLLADIDEAGGESAAKQLGPRAAFCKTDVQDDAQIGHCVSKAVTHWGSIDFLVNLAAVYLDAGMQSPRSDWLTALNTNVASTAMLIQAVAPEMIKRGGGAIVNFGSISGHIAQANRWVYPATKAAILQLTRNAAADLAKDNIRVNSVSPGWVWSATFD